MEKILNFFAFFLILVFCLAFKCDEQPELNKKILAFVKNKINHKVDRGECWDLAAKALDHAGAKWDHNYNFGKTVNLEKNECVYAGDIIQFENVLLEYKIKNSMFTEDLQHHTAIIYEVIKPGQYKIAQQNTSEHGKRVSIDPFEFSSVKRGTYTIFRPEK